MDRSLASTIRAANASLIAAGDLEAVGEFFAPDYVVHLTGRDMQGGHDFVRNHITLLTRVFPEIRVSVDILIEGHDRIAWQRTLEGVQMGPFAGFPASGMRIVWREMVTSRFRNGLIEEEWVVTDLAERLLRARKR